MNDDFDHEHIPPPIEFEPGEGETELTVSLEPDEEVLERLNREAHGDKSAYESTRCPVDLRLFDEVQKRCREIFLEKREEYGNSLDNSKRFPKEHFSGFYIKLARLIRMLEQDKGLDEDTLIDLIVYAIIIRMEQLIKEST